MGTPRRKTTIYIDEDLLRSVKILAASSDRHDYEVIEDALSQYVDAARAEAQRRALLLDDPSRATELDDGQAQELAYAELHALRSERRSD